MDDEWANRVLSLRYWDNRVEAEEYEDLVERALGQVTPDVADVLFRTFNDEDDHEIQENVIRVLHSAAPEVYMKALLAALPRLMAQASSWARVFVLREAKHNPRLLVGTANQMPKEVREVLILVMSEPSFLRRRANAQELIAGIDR
jgi:hypothetical protein